MRAGGVSLPSSDMGTYLVELYLARPDPETLRAAIVRARTAAEEMARDGTPVRYVRALYLPTDEICFLLYEGPAAHAVGETVRRAAIGFDRIVEVVEPGQDDG